MKTNIAVLGCGYWGKNLVKDFHALGVLGMVCDAAESGRATARKLAPGVAVVEAFEAVFNNQSISAVAIALPASLHYPLAKAAIQAGKDVYVEKPLCLHDQEGAELVRLADRHGKILMVGHLLHYHPCVQALQSLLAQGELGKLHYIASNRLNLGKIRREENALWSFAPHDISVILSLASDQLPMEVRCSGGVYLNHGVADTTLTSLRFTGGIQAHIFVSWLNPFKEQKLTVVGSSGMAVFDDAKPWGEKLVVYRQYLTWKNGQVPTPNGRLAEPIVPAEAQPLLRECEHFIECCSERRTPRTDGREGLRVLRVLQAAQRSLDCDGQAIDPLSVLLPLLDAPKPQAQNGGSAGLVQPPIQPVPHTDYYAHPTAVVDEGAAIGKGTKVWHFSHIMKGAKIGERCIFGQNVNVDGGTVIGNNVKIQNNVSIYSGLVIEDDVFLGPSCVLTNVTNPRSQVGRHHLYEKTLIKRGATVGANATIVCGVTIGQYAFVAAGAVVTKDVPDYGLVMGNPARRKGWISRHGHPLRQANEGVFTCPEFGFRYQETPDGQLRCLDLAEDQPLPANFNKGVATYEELREIRAREAGASREFVTGQEPVMV
jgi:UDP-2-acetamido-3-amino-2,3-dideoxy-glucuronate N-acetyltransferase